jgi:hypothetical protein
LFNCPARGAEITEPPKIFFFNIDLPHIVDILIFDLFYDVFEDQWRKYGWGLAHEKINHLKTP